MKYLFLIIALMVGVIATAQTAPQKNSIYTFVEQMPVASIDILEFIGKNFLLSEQTINQQRTPGRMALSFIVNEDGRTSNYKIVRSSGIAKVDSEFIRVIAAMPPWLPGKHNGEAVKVRYTQPLTMCFN